MSSSYLSSSQQATEIFFEPTGPKLWLFSTYGSPSDHKLGGYDGCVCYDEGFYKEQNVDIENVSKIWIVVWMTSFVTFW